MVKKIFCVVAVVTAGLFLAVCLARAESKEGKIETGTNYIANGLVRVELRTPPQVHRVFFSIWDEEAKSWTLLLSGGLGNSAGEVLRNEPAEEVKIAKVGDAATLVFKLVDWTKSKDDIKSEGDGKFYRVFKITIWDGKHKALVELVDTAEGGDKEGKEISWTYSLYPNPARYLLGRGGVYGGEDFVDCQKTFDKNNLTIQINSAAGPVGAYNPDKGYLYLVHQPKRYYMIACASESGAVEFYPGTDSHTLYGMNIGKGKNSEDVFDVVDGIVAKEK